LVCYDAVRRRFLNLREIWINNIDDR
jgi:hypothetical protein